MDTKTSRNGAINVGGLLQLGLYANLCQADIILRVRRYGFITTAPAALDPRPKAADQVGERI